MAPSKKKDKSKSVQWLQCTQCGKLICQQDAEIHSTSCAAGHSYIQDKVFHGEVTCAESLFEEGVPVSKTIRDKDSGIWIAMPTMQVCGLSIGQLCIVNGLVVKRTWPSKSLPLSSVALPQVCREEVEIKQHEFVTIERFFQQDGLIVESAVIRLREENPLFESEEFASFIAGYLDGKFITESSPLLIQYFGQACKCHVEHLKTRLMRSKENCDERDEAFSLNSQGRVSVSTPTSTKRSEKIASPVFSTPDNSSPASDPSAVSDAGASPVITGCSSSLLSDSLASLNISAETSVSSPSTTPETPLGAKYPQLVTPVKTDTSGQISDSKFAKVYSSETKFIVKSPSSDNDEERFESNKCQFSLDDIGGLSSQVEELKMRIERALMSESANCCLLLHGPPGTGKSLLVRALTSHLGISTTLLAGTDIWSKLFGEAESNLRKLFKQAQSRAPSIIVIDDIDVICPRRSQNVSGQQEHRIVGTLLSLIDEISSKRNLSQPVVVLGVTSNRDGIDSSLRRSGRFGCEIEIGVPTAPQRAEILQVLLRHVPHCLSKTDIETVANNAHGYVGADLAALVNEASMNVMMEEKDPHHKQMIIEDLVHAGLRVKPSALREIQLEVPQVRWSEIGGMTEVKMRLREAVELPLTHPEVYRQLGIEPPRGLLMYGPPGCSKTMVARALATECKLNFLAVKGPELFNQYVGESERAIREVFRKARAAAPSVIFFDEIDAIAAKRGSSSGSSGVDDRVLTQLLTEMDGLEFLKDVFIMAATNRPDKIDNALLRPGRFDSLVYVPLPDAETRGDILHAKFSKMVVNNDVKVAKLVDSTEGYSGAEVVQVCQEAALCALRENLDAKEVRESHFDTALQKVRPQVNPELLDIYIDFSQVMK